MSPEKVGITIGLVIGITFIFDVIELQPRAGFGFLRSLNYLFYHIFRVLLGFLASFLIFQVNPTLELPLIAFLAVLASVTTLQNFTMNIGGNEVASLSRLLDNYRETMLVEEDQRKARRAENRADSNTAESLRVQRRMMELFSIPELELHLRQMLLQAGWNANAINAHILELNNLAQNNQQFLEAMMAFQIADMNLEYARSLEAERMGSTRAALMTISTTSLPNGTVGVAYSQTLRATVGTPETWSIAGGSLPPGFSLNATTGTISGTPTTAGTFSFTAIVKGNSGGAPVTVTKDLSITIGIPPATL
jgi:hypothetical protein